MNISDHNYFSRFALDPASDSVSDDFYAMDFSDDDQPGYFDDHSPGQDEDYSSEDDDFWSNKQR